MECDEKIENILAGNGKFLTRFAAILRALQGHFRLGLKQKPREQNLTKQEAQEQCLETFILSGALSEINRFLYF